MNIKYYIATKQDKVGTAFTVARYEEDEFRSTYINKVATNMKRVNKSSQEVTKVSDKANEIVDSIMPK